MNTADIQSIINALPERMSEKGLRQVDAEFDIKANAQPLVILKWWQEKGYTNTHHEFIHADTPAAALDAAVKFITELPSAEETKRNTFIAALGKVIDLGNELGQDVGVLASEMKRLAENAITDQRGQRRAA